MHLPGAGMGSGDILRLTQTALDESDAGVAKKPSGGRLAVRRGPSVPVVPGHLAALSPRKGTDHRSQRVGGGGGPRGWLRRAAVGV